VFTSKAMAQANRSRNACCRRWWDLGNAMSSPTSATSSTSRRWVDQVPHPIELSKLGSRWAFSAAAVLVGFVAFVVGRGRRRVIRVALASTVLVATAAVALTRLYLGVRCLTDIGGGLLLGGAAVVTRVA
jgi:hypothetical protein